MHANQIRRATLVKASLALAPVLATSKLLGMMENNGETRQKPEAPYQSQINPVSKQQQLILVRERRIRERRIRERRILRADSQSEGAR